MERLASINLVALDKVNPTDSSICLSPPPQMHKKAKASGLCMYACVKGCSEDNILLNFQTGTITRGKPVVSAVGSFNYEESEILRIAAAVEKTASHPIAKAIINKAESLELVLPLTKGQLVEPGFGTLAEIDGRLVAVGSLEWVHEHFQTRMNFTDLTDLEHVLMNKSSNDMTSKYSKTIVYVGREGEGIIGAIAISDILRDDAKSTVMRYALILQLKSISFLRVLTTDFRP